MTTVTVECPFCGSARVRVITRYKGEDVEPEELLDFDIGSVYECLDCNEISGFVYHYVGVVVSE